MTDHLLEASADLHRSTGIYALTSAVGHILDHLTAQSGSVTDAITDAITDPLDENNHDDRYDHDGSRWWWCDKCGGFRLKIREGLGSLLHGAGGDPGRRHDQDRIRELGRQAGWLQARADNIAQGEKP